MKKKVGIIGYGRWAKKIVPIINRYASIRFISDSKISYKIFKEPVDWVFVLTNNNTHYQIVKYFLNKKINVFCEKPLTKSFFLTKSLIDLSKKNKVHLYVNDVENYKFKKIKKNKNYEINRRKMDNSLSKESILFRLAYHDFYLLYNELNKKEFKSEMNEKKNSLKIKLFLKNSKKFIFNYNLKSKKKMHRINSADFLNFKGNPLEKMIKSLLNDKVNYCKNKTQAMFCSKIIRSIQNDNR